VRSNATEEGTAEPFQKAKKEVSGFISKSDTIASFSYHRNEYSSIAQKACIRTDIHRHTSAQDRDKRNTLSACGQHEINSENEE
jgi:hypothetical protein